MNNETQGEQQAVAWISADNLQQLAAGGPRQPMFGRQHLDVDVPLYTRPKPVAGDAVRARIRGLIAEIDPQRKPATGEMRHVANELRAIAALSAAPAAPALRFEDADALVTHLTDLWCDDGGPGVTWEPARIAVEAIRAWQSKAALAPVAGDAVSALPRSWRKEAGIQQNHSYARGLDRCAEQLTAALAQDRASQGAKRVPTGPRFTNTGDSEAQFIADGDRLDCPACGGSGHAEDASQGAAAGVPADFITHRDAWRDGLNRAVRYAKDSDDASYWMHEVRAFDRAYAQLLAAAPSAPTQGAEREVGK